MHPRCSPLTSARRQRLPVAVLLWLALATTWLQFAWHAPMAAAGEAAICGGPLSAADRAALVAEGLLDAAVTADVAPCDLLTTPVATPPEAASGESKPPPALAVASPALPPAITARPHLRLPPAAAPPATRLTR